MAYLPEDDKQKQDEQMQAQQSGGAQSSGGSAFASSGSGGIGPTGAGGSGGWTNIQNYLAANAGNRASANRLSNQGKSTFDSEKSAFDTQEQTARTTAKEQVDKNRIEEPKAKEMLGVMGQNYQYGGKPQNEVYGQNKSIFQNSLNSTYGGPQSFAYGKSQDYQNMESGLNNNFSGVMGNIYNQAAGGQIKGGQLALQRQLDQENTALQDTRNNLINQYAGFSTDMNNRIADTDTFVKSQAKQFGDDQEGLRKYLGGEQTTAQNEITSQVGLANQAIDDAIANYRGEVLPEKKYYYRKGTNSAPGVATGTSSLTYQGPRASVENMSELDDERRAFNSIADILGTSAGYGISDQDFGTGKFVVNRNYDWHKGADVYMDEFGNEIDPNTYFGSGEYNPYGDQRSIGSGWTSYRP